MAGNEKFATEMRDAVKAIMEADPYYLDIPIITERLQNIDAKIDAIVGKAGGICIVLVTVSFGSPIVNLPGANFDKIGFVARVFENVKSNPTGKEAQHVALYTAALWSQLVPDALSAPLKLDDPGVSLGNDPRFLTYDTRAVTEGGTKIEIPQLDPPLLDFSNPPAKLSCPQSGAAAFYTFDGSAPFPRNPAAAAFVDMFANLPSPKPAYDDGVHAYVWDPAFGIYYTSVPAALGDFWRINVATALTSSSGNAEAVFQHYVDSVLQSDWDFQKIGGVWTLTNSTPGPDTAPAIADGYSFFPQFKMRARAWLAGYLPSNETTCPP